MIALAIALAFVGVCAWDIARRFIADRARAQGQEYLARLEALEKRQAAMHEELTRKHAALTASVASTQRLRFAGLQQQR